MLHKDLDSNYILVKTRLISVSDAVMTIILYKNCYATEMYYLCEKRGLKLS